MSTSPDTNHTLVVVVLRGGMDGLSAVPPLGDPAYGTARSRLAVGDSGPEKAIPLDSHFGLNPLLSPLKQLYDDKCLAIVQACGSPCTSLSHFEAQERLELAQPAGPLPSSGWVTRYLDVSASSNAPLRAIALGNNCPDSLLGYRSAVVMSSITESTSPTPTAWTSFSTALGELYAVGEGPASVAGRATRSSLNAIRRVASAAHADIRAEDSESTRRLVELAALIREDVGLEFAQVDIGGWDTHVRQKRAIQDPLKSLAQGLTRFYETLGSARSRATLIALSEFGRRVSPNSGGGTDHGGATALLVLGSNIDGGRVLGDWPGLAHDQLDRNLNLRVTSDYRDVLAEVLQNNLKALDLTTVFPGHTRSAMRLMK